MTPEIAEVLTAYLATRDQARADDVAAALNAFTDRERELVREAAVMGYVRGTMAGGREIPLDSAIVSLVVACCQSMADMYPLIAGSVTEAVRWIVKTNQPVLPSALVPAVAELCACEPAVVDAAVSDLVDDDILVHTADGLRIGDAA